MTRVEIIREDLRARVFRVTLPRCRKTAKIVLAEIGKLDDAAVLRTRGGRYLSPLAYNKLEPIVRSAIKAAKLEH